MPGLTLTVFCRALTPMLTGGAYPKETFELRPQSVKGALRFWWRAFHAYESETVLFEEESRLFGGQLRKRGNEDVSRWNAVAAPFRLDVFCDDYFLFEPGRGKGADRKPLPGDSTGWGDGVQYCLFPLLAAGNIKNVEKGGRPVAREGFTFRLRFQVLDGSSEILGEILRAFWLLTNLGGIGGRTRRGAGSFGVEGFEPRLDQLDVPELPDFDATGYVDPAAFLRAGLKKILARWFRASPCRNFPSYTAFRPGHSEIRIFYDPVDRVGSGARAAMEAIGRQMKHFRHTNPHDEAKSMHEALTGEGASRPAIACLEKAQMGLPIIYNFTGRGEFGRKVRPQRGINYEAKGVVYDEKKGEAETGNDENVQRRASPVLVSCHEFKGTPYAVVCHFPAPILPAGQRIWLKSTPAGHDAFPKAPEGYDYVDRLVMLGDTVAGEIRHPIRAGFTTCWEISRRPAKVSSAEEPEEKALSEPLSPEERKLKSLQQAPIQKDGLTWYLAEITGPPIGSRKKQKWPCRLYRLEESALLVEEQGIWFVRYDKLLSARGITPETGSAFLCTKQPDERTQPAENYVHNITKPPY